MTNRHQQPLTDSQIDLLVDAVCDEVLHMTGEEVERYLQAERRRRQHAGRIIDFLLQAFEPFANSECLVTP